MLDNSTMLVISPSKTPVKNPLTTCNINNTLIYPLSVVTMLALCSCNLWKYRSLNVVFIKYGSICILRKCSYYTHIHSFITSSFYLTLLVMLNARVLIPGFLTGTNSMQKVCLNIVSESKRDMIYILTALNSSPFHQKLY